MGPPLESRRMPRRKGTVQKPMLRKKGSPISNTTFRLSPEDLADLDLAKEVLGVSTRVDTVRLMIRNTLSNGAQAGSPQLEQIVDRAVAARLPGAVRDFMLTMLSPGGGKTPG